MRHRILLAASLLYLSITHILWIAIDTRPPFWDMANHASWAMGVLRNFQLNGIAALATLPQNTSGYPPLYHAIVALSYSVFGTSIDTAQLANFPATVLLTLATTAIARRFMDATTAALAGALASFFPFILWISRETLIETWLTAMVALSIWALLKTNDFSDTKWSLVFGVLCGLGMLTKWTFVLFAGPPALWAARKHWSNALKAAAVAAVLAAYWYVPQFQMMQTFWRQAAVAAQNEGDATIFTMQGWLFYIRAAEGSLLFLPLFLAFFAGVIVLMRNWRSNFPKWTPLVLYLLGGWLGLMLLPNQDPRYAAAALPAVAVITAAAFERKPAAQIVLVVLLVFQHILVSFGIPQLPERVVLMEGRNGPVRYDWNLYTQSYFGLWGKPEQQDWKIEHVLQTVSEGASRPVQLGLIPDLPRFDGPAFQFYIERDRYPVVISRQFFADEIEIQNKDYLLMSLGEQSAFSSPAPHAYEINAHILAHPELFQVVDTFSLPNGEMIRLYRCVR
jgi:4-amino-4-deoxy-L-arabinose transferase-like glycosyltransferase